MEETVAITHDPNQPAPIVPYTEAQALYQTYNALTLTHKEDEALFRALVVALGVQPKPFLSYGTEEQTLAARHIADWKAKYAK